MCFINVYKGEFHPLSCNYILRDLLKATASFKVIFEPFLTGIKLKIFLS